MYSPTLDDLRTLDAAIRTGSLSAAARELGVSQQAASSRLRELERLVGVTLAHRSATGVTPTESCRAVLAHVREVLDASARLDDVLAALSDQATVGSIAVGASQTVAAHLLPGWLVHLRRGQEATGRPATEIVLQTANSEQIIALVRSGGLDLGFIESPTLPTGLGHAAVARDRMVVAVHPKHEWVGRASLALELVASTPLVTRELGSGTRATFEAAVRHELGRDPAAPALVLATEAAVKSAVASGVAPAVLSELTIRDDVQLGRISAIPFEAPTISRLFTAIWRGTQRDLTGVRRELVATAASISG